MTCHRSFHCQLAGVALAFVRSCKGQGLQLPVKSEELSWDVGSIPYKPLDTMQSLRNPCFDFFLWHLPLIQLVMLAFFIPGIK